MRPLLKKAWLAAAASLVAVLAVFMLAMWLYLPTYLETRLLPRWSTAAGVDLHALRIRHIGWRSTDLGPIHMEIGQHLRVDIAAIQLDYSPASLLRKELTAIVISAPRIELTMDGFIAASKESNRQTQPPSATNQAWTASELSARLPVRPIRLTVKNGVFSLLWRSGTLHSPFDLDLDTAGLQEGTITGTARTAPWGNPLRIAGTLDTNANAVTLDLTGEGLVLETLTPLLAPLSPALEARGLLDVTAQIQGQIQPPALAALAFESRLRHTRITLPDLTLGNHTNDEGAEVPIRARIRKQADTPWQWALGPFQADTPIRLQVSTLGGTLTPHDAGWRATVEALTEIPVNAMNTTANPTLLLETPLAMTWQSTARLSPSAASVEFEVRGTGAPSGATARLAARHGELVLSSRQPRVAITGAYDDGNLEARYEATLENLRIQLPAASAHCPKVAIAGALDNAGGWHIHGTADLSDIGALVGTASATLPKNRSTFRIEKANTADWSLTGEIRMDDGQIVDTTHDVRLLGLSAQLPVRWPLKPSPAPGTLKAGPIYWRTELLGTLDGRLGLHAGGFWAKATHRSKLFPGMTVLFNSRLVNSRLDGTALQMDLTMPTYTPPQNVDLGRFAASATGFQVNGRFSAAAELATDGGALRSTGRVQIDQAVVRHPESGLLLEGIACDLQITDLMGRRTAPNQQLRVARLALGKLEASNLQLAFQLEPPGILFVENLEMAWARGRLQTQAFRLSPQQAELTTTVHGDRLNLAMVLEQLGGAEASGDGTVNGRIPVRWQNGRLRFDDGFLYSTPSQAGTIKLREMDLPLEGLAPGSPQRTQLDIATEALKDYSYDWAKLHLTSQNGDLLLRLELDGRPNRLLPFAYDPQTGSFQRYAGEGQAEFKGIRIDLNFRTPLDRILDYKTLWTPRGR